MVDHPASPTAAAVPSTDPVFRIVRILGFDYVTGPKVATVHLYLLAIIDWFARLMLGRQKPAPAPPMEGKVIAIAKIDLLGDVLIMSPLLRELRRQTPASRLLLVLGSWGAEAGRLLQDEGLCDGVILYDPPTMSPARTSLGRKMKQGLTTFRRALAELRREKVDVYLDLRWSSPNSLLLAHLAGVPHVVGYALRGYSYLLQQAIPFDGTVPMGQQYLDALGTLGLRPVAYDQPCLHWRGTREPLPAQIAAEPSFFVLHPFSRNARKMISAETWKGILALLAGHRRVIVIGARDDLENRELVEMLTAAGCDLSAVGQTTFRQAVACVRAARAFIGVDSVFSHVALAFDKPTYVAAIRGASFRGAFPAANRNLFYDVVPLDTDTSPSASTVLPRYAEVVSATFTQLHPA